MQKLTEKARQNFATITLGALAVAGWTALVDTEFWNNPAFSPWRAVRSFVSFWVMMYFVFWLLERWRRSRG
ncbi:MAG: hypothetical protein RJA94_2029 [Pseudomonadota bacterium]